MSEFEQPLHSLMKIWGWVLQVLSQTAKTQIEWSADISYQSVSPPTFIYHFTLNMCCVISTPGHDISLSSSLLSLISMCKSRKVFVGLIKKLFFRAVIIRAKMDNRFENSILYISRTLSSYGEELHCFDWLWMPSIHFSLNNYKNSVCANLMGKAFVN